MSKPEDRKSYALRLPADEFDSLRFLASTTNRSMNSLVVQAVHEFLHRTGSATYTEQFKNLRSSMTSGDISGPQYMTTMGNLRSAVQSRLAYTTTSVDPEVAPAIQAAVASIEHFGSGSQVPTSVTTDDTDAYTDALSAFVQPAQEEGPDASS